MKVLTVFSWVLTSIALIALLFFPDKFSWFFAVIMLAGAIYLIRQGFSSLRLLGIIKPWDQLSYGQQFVRDFLFGTPLILLWFWLGKSPIIGILGIVALLGDAVRLFRHQD
ncbi:MAG: hypothetical protein KC443_17750 [Anaerolineales bacterium]|nr:hypothetical protein [Anaerolineales bacterium]